MEPPALGFPGAGAQEGETRVKESQGGSQVAGLRKVTRHSPWPRPHSSAEVMMLLPPQNTPFGGCHGASSTPIVRSDE